MRNLSHRFKSRLSLVQNQTKLWSNLNRMKTMSSMKMSMKSMLKNRKMRLKIKQRRAKRTMRDILVRLDITLDSKLSF